jgi:hypothetical protein
METHVKAKDELFITAEPRPPKHSRRTLYGVLFAGLLVLYPLSCAVTRHHRTSRALEITDVCPQVEPLTPSSDTNRKLADDLEAVFANHSFKAIAAEHLGAAVRIP